MAMRSLNLLGPIPHEILRRPPEDAVEPMKRYDVTDRSQPLTGVNQVIDQGGTANLAVRGGNLQPRWSAPAPLALSIAQQYA